MQAYIADIYIFFSPPKYLSASALREGTLKHVSWLFLSHDMNQRKCEHFLQSKEYPWLKSHDGVMQNLLLVTGHKSSFTRQMTTPSLLHKPVIASLRVVFNVIWPLFGATTARYQGGFGFNESKKKNIIWIGKHGLCCCIWLRCWSQCQWNVGEKIFKVAFYKCIL